MRTLPLFLWIACLPTLTFAATTSQSPRFSEGNPRSMVSDGGFKPVDATGEILPENLRKIMNAMGRLSNGCTVTHLGNGIAVTAGHCFWTHHFYQDPLSCEGMTVSWGERENQPPFLESKCKRIVRWDDSQFRDFALLEVDPIPPNSAEWSNALSPPDEKVALEVLSYPHGKGLTFSDACAVQKVAPSWLPSTVFHNCNTLSGASGAPIIDPVTGKILAVHNGGVSLWGWGVNYGTSVQQIFNVAE